MFIAHSIGVAVCENPDCRAIHVVMYDEHGQVGATAEIPTEATPEFIKNLQDTAYHVVVMKDGRKPNR